MDSLVDIAKTFHLDECVKFIANYSQRRVVLQFKRQDLKYSQPIVEYLTSATETNQEKSIEQVEFYVSQSKTCCLDLLVTQHVSKIDGIIHFGDLCISQPHANKSQLEIPVLCVFKNRKNDQFFPDSMSTIKSYLDNLLQDESIQKVCILYDPNCVDFVVELSSEIDRQKVDISKLVCPNTYWQVCDKHSSYFCYKSDNLKQHGYYSLAEEIKNYDFAIYLGSCPHIELILNGPRKFTRIICTDDVSVEEVDVQKLLRKRVALVNRIKDYEDLKIGVIITNPLPNVSKIVQFFETAAKYRKHILYFISMIQTIDDCMIGNFDLFDAFVIVNSCQCTSIIESLYFNRPILTATEFQLACGIETNYGNVLWPGYQSNASNYLTGDDLLNKRRVSDVSIALIHTRNELLERCNQAKLNRWSGLDYDTEAIQESLDIEEGLKGIASTYSSEPLKPSGKDQNKPQ